MRELNPVQWAVLPLKKYADFSGRAPRAEYWWYALATVIIGMGLAYLDKVIDGPTVGETGLLSLVFTLATLVPGLAVAIRRLHDIDRTGWWVVLNFWSYVFVVLGLSSAGTTEQLFKGNLAFGLVFLITMLVCSVTMLVFAVTQGTEGSNRYGPDPYGSGTLEEVFA
jgi:uncharacterized membrane protein YhaH (DUF805 family)